MQLEFLQYPIGRFEYGGTYSLTETEKNISKIGELSAKLFELANKLTSKQLRTSYREGAWTATQLFNHLGDVFVNAYIRTKWLLTEDNPTIKTYDENGCALLPDSHYSDLEVSLAMTDALIKRWVFLLANIDPGCFKKTLYHPEYQVSLPLDEMIAAYCWHAYHHLAHLEIICSNQNLTLNTD